MGQMEPGMGWNYPPGCRTDTWTEELACADCGVVRTVKVVSELGASWYEPEETPCCGADWVEPGDDE